MGDIFEDTSWIVPLRSPMATAVFYCVTQLGNIEILLLILPMVFWLQDKRFFKRLALLLVFTVILDGLLKGYFNDPRPDPANAVDHMSSDPFSFPSDHTTLAAAFWFFLAYQFRHRRFTFLATMIVLGVGASRLYLGVHDLDDIPPSIALGWAIAFMFQLRSVPGLRSWPQLLPMVQIALLAGVPALGIVPLGDAIVPAYLNSGLALGLAWFAGAICDRDALGFKAHPRLVLALGAAAIGLAVSFALYELSAMVLETLPFGEPIDLSLQVLLMATFASRIAPALFRVMGLANHRIAVAAVEG